MDQIGFPQGFQISTTHQSCSTIRERDLQIQDRPGPCSFFSSDLYRIPRAEQKMATGDRKHPRTRLANKERKQQSHSEASRDRCGQKG